MQGNITKFIDSHKNTHTTSTYNAFGEMFPSSDTNPWRYASKRTDLDTKLILFGKRDYSPNLGRWLTHDPAGFTDSINLYQYVLNNPFTYPDPDGRFVFAIPLLALTWMVVAIAAVTSNNMRTNNMTKFFIFLSLLGIPILSFCDLPKVSEKFDPKYLIQYGDPEAEVSLEMGISLTCNRCMEFIQYEFPQIKEAWIDTGLLHWTFYPLPADLLTIRGMTLLEQLSEPVKKLVLEKFAGRVNRDSWHGVFYQEDMLFFEICQDYEAEERVMSLDNLNKLRNTDAFLAAEEFLSEPGSPFLNLMIGNEHHSHGTFKAQNMNHLFPLESQVPTLGWGIGLRCRGIIISEYDDTLSPEDDQISEEEEDDSWFPTDAEISDRCGYPADAELSDL